MCFGVRFTFSLYLASCLPDFDHLFSVCVVWGGGGIMWGPEKKGGTNLKKGGDWSPVPPPPPPDPPMNCMKNPPASSLARMPKTVVCNNPRVF